MQYRYPGVVGSTYSRYFVCFFILHNVYIDSLTKANNLILLKIKTVSEWSVFE